MLGKKYGDPLVEESRHHFTYKLVEDKARGTYNITVGELSFYPEEVVAMLLRHFKRVAEKASNTAIVDVILTTDPFTTVYEREALADAARIAGLRPLSIINGPTAFALTYGMERKVEKLTRSVFFDIGASSLKVSLVTYDTTPDKKSLKENAMIRDVTVVATEWDDTLGGREFDSRIADILAERVKTEAPRIDCTTPKNRQFLLREAVRVKQILSVNKDCLVKMEGGPDDPEYHGVVTREEFERRSADLFGRVLDPIKRAMKRANWTVGMVDFLEIVGGTTRIPYIQQLVLDYFHLTELSRHVSADESSSMGAVYWWGMKSGAPIQLKETYPFAVQIKPSIGTPRPLFKSGTRLGNKKTLTFTTEAKNFTIAMSYDPDDPGALPLPRGLCREIATYEFSGMPTKEEYNYTSTPKAVVAYKLEASGIITLTKAEAEFEVVKMVKEQVRVPKNATAPDAKPVNGTAVPKNATVGEQQPSKEGAKEHGQAGEAAKKEAAPNEKEAAGAKRESKTEGAEHPSGQQQEQPKENSADKKEANEQASAPKEEKKPEVEYEYVEVTKPIKTVKKHKLTVVRTSKCFAHLNKEQIAAASKHLDQFDEANELRLKTGAALNTLESTVYRIKGKILDTDEDDEVKYAEYAKPEELDKLRELVSQVSDWLEDEGYDSVYEEYEKRQKSIDELTDKIFRREKEFRKMPKALGKFARVLNDTRAALHPNITSMFNVTEKELQEFADKLKENEEWLKNVTAEFAGRKKNDEPKTATFEVKLKYKLAENMLKKLFNLPLKKVEKNEVKKGDEKAANETQKAPHNETKPEEGKDGKDGGNPQAPEQKKQASNEKEQAKSPEQPKDNTTNAKAKKDEL